MLQASRCILCGAMHSSDRPQGAASSTPPPPTSTFHNQILPLVGWGSWAGGVVCAIAMSPQAVVDGRVSSSVDALWAVLAILAGAAGLSALQGLPLSFVSSALGPLHRQVDYLG